MSLLEIYDALDTNEFFYSEYKKTEEQGELVGTILYYTMQALAADCGPASEEVWDELKCEFETKREMIKDIIKKSRDESKCLFCKCLYAEEHETETGHILNGAYWLKDHCGNWECDDLLLRQKDKS